MTGPGAAIMTKYFMLRVADDASVKLSRFPRATTRDAMCSGCCEIREDWRDRPVEVHLSDDPGPSGPIPTILSCVMLVMVDQLWAELAPVFPRSSVGPVVWGPKRAVAQGWVSVHTPRSERVLARVSGERAKYDQCGVCGTWRFVRSDGEMYLVEDEVRGRDVVHGGRVFVSPDVRKRLLSVGIPGLAFAPVRVCRGPKAPL